MISCPRLFCRHPLNQHTQQLRCKICDAECGLDCTRHFTEHETSGQGKLL